MHEPPPADERPGCRETLLLTRAFFAAVLPFMAVMIGVLLAVSIALALFTVHPALALLPVAAVGLAIYLYARWERGRFQPPGL